MSHRGDQVTNDAVAVTTSDSTIQPGFAFRVGTGAGDVTIVTEKGTTTTIPSVQLYETVVVSFTKIMATGTAATGITRFCQD